MSDLVAALNEVPAGFWTLAVAILGFGFTGWSNFQSRKERDSIRQHEESNISSATEHANAQTWRQVRLEAIDEFLARYEELSVMVSGLPPEFGDRSKLAELETKMRELRTAGSRIETRSTVPVVESLRDLLEFVDGVVRDVDAWRSLKYYKPGDFNNETYFGPQETFHAVKLRLEVRRDQFIEVCRQEMGIIEYQLPRLKESQPRDRSGLPAMYEEIARLEREDAGIVSEEPDAPPERGR